MAAKVVIDTNIYISAIFWGGKPREVVDLGRDKKILIFTSLDIEEEIAEKLRTKFKLDKEEVNRILLDFSIFTIPVEVTKRVQAVPNDPEDDKFIECAISCNAELYCLWRQASIKPERVCWNKNFKSLGIPF